MRLQSTADAIAVIEEQLGPQEYLLWAGKPQGGLLLRAGDAFLIPFSLLWCGFVVFWETMVVTQGAPVFFCLWGIPFVLVGLYLVFGRFLVDRNQREHTFYGITNERVVIASGIVRRTVKSLNLRTLTDMSLTEWRDGRGTITFGQSSFFPWWFQGTAWPGCTSAIQPSSGSPNAKDLYELVRN